MTEAALTLKGLIHELAAEYTMADEPVLVSGWDSAGNLAEFTVSGISVKDARRQARPVAEALPRRR